MYSRHIDTHRGFKIGETHAACAAWSLGLSAGIVDKDVEAFALTQAGDLIGCGGDAGRVCDIELNVSYTMVGCCDDAR